MPRGAIPDSYAPLLHGPTNGRLANIGSDGCPEGNPVWFLWEHDRLLPGVKAETGKHRNLRRNPALAMSVANPADPRHYLELRGQVREFALCWTLDFVNRLSLKYTGQPMDPVENGKERFGLTVEIDSWTGQ